jgi:murein DD-endopeptidase MepM/ murein hydrolase activator NlpD
VSGSRFASTDDSFSRNFAAPLLLLLLGVTITLGLWLRGQRVRSAERRPVVVSASRAEMRNVAREVSREPGAPGELNVAPEDLARRALLIPVVGVEPQDLRDSFDEGRSGHTHEAIDILAPRNTPVRAVEDGVIAKLFHSVPGGITIYQFDPSGDYCYYYAHLERYADDLANGQQVRRGQVIGYVGTSGNAPKDTPHLHFAIYRLDANKRWWEGTALDPYPVLRNGAPAAP